ncbi:MAG: EamA family transporter [bacterium]
MIWQVFATLCSVSYAFQNLAVKGLNRRRVSSINVLWYMFAAAVPILLVFYRTLAVPGIEPLFPVYLGLGVTINIFSFYGYVRAIELTDVSLVSPLLSLSPLFMLFTSWVMLDELPDLMGLLGVLAIVVGTYFLSRTKGGSGLEPFRRLLQDPGVIWALVVSMVWSITANIDKLAVRTSTPITYAFWFHALFAILFTPIFLVLRDNKIFTGENADKSSFKGFIPPIYLVGGGLLAVGVLQAVMSATQMIAVIRTKVTYVIAIKRAGMLISVLGGGFLFKERNTGRRFFAATLVFVGLIGIMFR